MDYRRLPAGTTDLALGGLHDVLGLSVLTEDLSVAAITGTLGSYPGTQGNEELRGELSALSRDEDGSTVPPECIVVTHGALDALAHALRGAAPRRVIYPTPGFDVGLAAARMQLPAVAIAWGIDRPVSDLLEGLAKALASGPGNEAVVVNFPSNPGGAEPSDDEWTELVDLTDQFGASLVVDDVYRFTTEPTPRPRLSAPHVIAVDSLSKRFGMPGLRLGWARTTGPSISAIRRSLAQSSVGVGLATAAVATHALDRYSPSVAVAVRAELSRRRAAVRDALGSTPLVMSDSGLYGCIVLGDQESEGAVVDALAQDGLRVTPGAALTASERPLQPFIRFCIGSSADVGELLRQRRHLFDSTTVLQELGGQ